MPLVSSAPRATRLNRAVILRAAALARPSAFAKAVAHVLSAPEPVMRLPGARVFQQRILPRLPERLKRWFERGATALAIYGDLEVAFNNETRVLLITNELAASGAPKIVVEMAEAFREMGCSVIVLSPEDGAFRAVLTALGAAVIVDRNLLSGIGVVAKIGHYFGLAVCNTVVTERVVAKLSRACPCYWYIHEVSLLQGKLDERGLRDAISRACEVWAGSELPAALLRPIRSDVRVVPYGLDAISAGPPAGAGDRPARIGLFGSVEFRKGQDLALEAIKVIALSSGVEFELHIFGRILSEVFGNDILRIAATLPMVHYGGELEYCDYIDQLRSMDAILIASRDDTLPLVSLDALSSGRVLLLSTCVGTSSYIEDGISGFVSAEASVDSLALMLQRALERRHDWPEVGDAGRNVFKESFSKVAFRDHLRAALQGMAVWAPS